MLRTLLARALGDLTGPELAELTTELQTIQTANETTEDAHAIHEARTLLRALTTQARQEQQRRETRRKQAARPGQRWFGNERRPNGRGPR